MVHTWLRVGAAVLTLLITAAAAAQEPATQPVAMVAELPPEPAPESIDRELADAARRPAGILKYGPVSILDPAWKKLNEALKPIGLKVGLAYTAAFQAASNGPGERTLAGGETYTYVERDADGRTAAPGAGVTDLALSRNSHFLYGRLGNGTVGVWAIGNDGSLTDLGSAAGLPNGAAGIAAS